MCNPDLNIDSHVWMVGGRKRSWQQVFISKGPTLHVYTLTKTIQLIQMNVRKMRKHKKLKWTQDANIQMLRFKI